MSTLSHEDIQELGQKSIYQQSDYPRPFGAMNGPAVMIGPSNEALKLQITSLSWVQLPSAAPSRPGPR